MLRRITLGEQVRGSDGAASRTLFALTIAATATLLLAGCGGQPVRRLEVTPPSAVQALAFDVRNERGGVILRVDPDAEKIRARARLRDGGLPIRVSREVSDAVEFYPEVQAPIEGRAVANFIVESSRRRPDHQVDVTITTPRCQGVRIDAGGPITLIGVSGAVEAQTPDGAIELRTDQSLTEPVALTTDRGDVILHLSHDSAGELDLQASQGEINFRSRTVAPQWRSQNEHRWRGVFNNGANPIVARAQKGDIVMRIVEQPESLIPAFR